MLSNPDGFLNSLLAYRSIDLVFDSGVRKPAHVGSSGRPGRRIWRVVSTAHAPEKTTCSPGPAQRGDVLANCELDGFVFAISGVASLQKARIPIEMLRIAAASLCLPAFDGRIVPIRSADAVWSIRRRRNSAQHPEALRR